MSTVTNDIIVSQRDAVSAVTNDFMVRFDIGFWCQSNRMFFFQEIGKVMNRSWRVI